MDNNYYYEMPNENKEPEHEPKKEKKKAPLWVKFLSLGLVFGLSAGLIFGGTNIVLSRLAGSKNSAITSKVGTTETKDSATITSGSGKTVSSDIADITKNAMPSVVSITNMSVQQVRDFFGGTREQESVSAGSGIIIGQNDDELLIVTNNHVVQDSNTLTVSFIDEESVEAKIKGTDTKRDLAVIAVSNSDIKDSTKEQIKVATVGNSDDLQVGEPAIAIGNALGYGQSVTTGIISAVNREIDMEGFEGKLIQTDAAINPGNSGGALLNAKGEVIGINTVKTSDVAVEGIGYAIPISDASDVITTLMNKTTKTKVAEGERGVLGIKGFDVTKENAELYEMPTGVYVSEVIEKSGADKAGIKKGSVITGIDGTEVDSMTTLQEELQYYKAGEKVTLEVQTLKDGTYEANDVEITLGSN